MNKRKKVSRLIGHFVRPEQRGYAVGVYREGQRNDCPGCGRCHWTIGRVTAECAFCSTAMPLEIAASGSTVIQHRNMTHGSHFRLAA